MERKHIFILLYRRDTWNQDTTGALFTRKQDVGNQSDRLFELHADFILRRQRLRGQEDVFFIKRCFFFSYHNTLDTSWEHRKYMEKVI